MLRSRDEDQFRASHDGGVRHLFELGPYTFQDTMDADEAMHHFIAERSEGGEESYYEVDPDTMYEFMARYLAGAYEVERYRLERSPGHDSLLDVLEIATARARAGESEFSWEEFDRAETELMEDDLPDDDGMDEQEEEDENDEDETTDREQP